MEQQSELIVNKVLKGTYEGLYMFGERGGMEVLEDMPPGIYRLEDIGGAMLSKIAYRPVVDHEKYITFEGGVVREIIDRASNFFTEEVKQKYADLQISHKTAFLLFGPPGTGKTVAARIAMQKLVDNYNAIAIVVPPKFKFHLMRWAIQELQRSKRPIIVFIDECEYTFKVNELDWLTFLDGGDSVTNCITIGCTNYENLISPRLKRPSRIEHHIEVKGMEYEVALQYLQEKLSKMPDSLKTGMAYVAVEAEATVDEYKNAIKQFYIHSKSDDIEEFKKILAVYRKSRTTQAMIDIAGRSLFGNDENN